MSAYKRNDEWDDTWHYRKQFTLPDGTKMRVAGTPAINSKEEAERAERDHVARELAEVRGETKKGVFARGQKLWIRFKDERTGKWRSATTGLDVGQEESAEAMRTEVLAEIERTIDAEDSRARKAAKPIKHGSGWRIRYIDADGVRQSATFDDYETAERELDRRSAIVKAAKTQPHGLPVRLRVFAVYGNGAEREIQAVIIAAASEHNDHTVQFETFKAGDEEFTIAVGRYSSSHRTTDRTDVWQFDPETLIDETGAPF